MSFKPLPKNPTREQWDESSPNAKWYFLECEIERDGFKRTIRDSNGAIVCRSQTLHERLDTGTMDAYERE